MLRTQVCWHGVMCAVCDSRLRYHRSSFWLRQGVFSAPRCCSCGEQGGHHLDVFTMFEHSLISQLRDDVVLVQHELMESMAQLNGDVVHTVLVCFVEA